MNWLFIVVGALLVWLAIDIVLMQRHKTRLPRPVLDEMQFGKGQVSEAQRIWARQRVYNSENPWQLLTMAALIATIGMALLAVGFGLF